MYQPADETTPNTLIKVAINQFRPIGALFPISAVLTVPNPSPSVTVVNGDIVVTSTTAEMLTFQIDGTDYIFVGVAFDTTTPGTDVGADEYPTATIKRSNLMTPSSSLAVYDANLAPNLAKSYNYILLVQSTSTGEIGIIDPMIRNDVVP